MVGGPGVAALELLPALPQLPLPDALFEKVELLVAVAERLGQVLEPGPQHRELGAVLALLLGERAQPVRRLQHRGGRPLRRLTLDRQHALEPVQLLVRLAGAIERLFVELLGRWLGLLTRVHDCALEHLGFLAAPLGQLLDPIEADDLVDHALTLGRLHGRQLLDVALVRGAGHVEHVEAEAEQALDVFVDWFGAGDEQGIRGAEFRCRGRPVDLVALALQPEGQRGLERLVVVGLATQRGRAEQTPAGDLDDERLAGLVRASDGAEALLEVVLSLEGTTSRRERDAIRQPFEHGSSPLPRTIDSCGGWACKKIEGQRRPTQVLPL
jgi:hypothetical protein